MSDLVGITNYWVSYAILYFLEDLVDRLSFASLLKGGVGPDSSEL